MPTSRTSRTASSKPKLKLKWWYVLPVILIVLIAGYAIVRFSKAGSEAGHHCFVKKSNATLWCWGDNSKGQLGIGTIGGWQGAPKQVPIVNVASVATGAYHTCASKTDGTLWCWGDNTAGELGTGDKTRQLYPKQLFFNNTAKVTAGGGFTCASKTDGTLWCWGYNNQGTLGINSAVSQTLPKQLFFANTANIAAGDNHMCASKTDGTLWCWGYNVEGQLGLGNGAPTVVYAPRQLFFDKTSSISAGYMYTCASKTDGSLWCWGRASAGQLGIGNTNSTYYNTPKQLFFAGTAKVSAGRDTTCASKTDGTLWCWGNNFSGQLGIGNTSNQNTPKQLFFANTALVDSSLLNNCASKTDGTVWCWGSGYRGANGLGADYNNKLVPTQLFLNVN